MSQSSEPFSCDLCSGKTYRIIFPEGPDSCQLAICETCHVISAYPLLSPEALDAFYDDSFANDPGSHLRSGSGPPAKEHLEKERMKATKWGVSLISQYIDPTNKHILDLRCRTGVLSALLEEQGATVTCVEPFRNNANVAREVRKLTNVLELPFSRFTHFPLAGDDGYDIVNMLAHHVLAHVLSPRNLLQHVYESLKPGGFLFLDEKDIFFPTSHKKRSVLDSGKAHQYHLTADTTQRYLQSVGFNVLECQLDPTRKSDFRHIRAVAQKPKSESDYSPPHFNTSSVSTIERRLWLLKKTSSLRLFTLYSKRRIKKWFRGKMP